MRNNFCLMIGLFLVGLAIRNIYELLKKAQRIAAGNRLAFAVVFAGMGVMWVSWFTLCPLDPYHLSLPESVRWVGLAMVMRG